MPRVAFLGSCCAASIARSFAELPDRSNRRGVGLAHMRSDVLRDVLVTRAWRPAPAAALEAFAERRGNPDFLDVNRRRLRAQSSEAVDGFLEELAVNDVVILDNHYDITARLFPGDETIGRDHRLKLVPNDAWRAEVIPRLTAVRSNACMRGVIEWLRATYPNLFVCFVPTPRSAGGHRGPLHDDYDRNPFDMETADRDRLLVFPKLNFRESAFDTSHGVSYFDDGVYGKYRAVILRGLCGAKIGEAEIHAEFRDVLRDGPVAEKTGEAVEASGRAHPYAALPDTAFWRKAVSGLDPLAIEGLYARKFDLDAAAPIATFGSCFAQHIGRRLKNAGFNYMDCEAAPDQDAQHAAARGFGMFSARYGNVYTPRQLNQLFLRAHGRFEPVETVWSENGRHYDPFRPTIEPDGFASPEALLEDRRAHFAAVRTLLTDARVIVFTFGLTESWEDARDGAVYPLCPGTAHGRFDPAIHRFRNYDVVEAIADFEAFMANVAAANPDARFLLTVSPVPLVATASGEHVLVATSRSKSILRAACAHLCAKHASVDYFPSYEVIASHPFRGMFFEPNMRAVSLRGIDHVMKHFFAAHPPPGGPAAETETDDELHCDEILLDAGMSGA